MRILLELSKARITVFVALSVATGYLLFAQRFEWAMLLPMGGIFLIASGSATWNQVQERKIDARMARTKGRPIPSGRIGPDWAAFVGVVLAGAGFYLLSLVDHHVYWVLGLGAFSVVWYNGVYLLLKRVTAFAVVPGALLGAVPPVIGWCAAGGVAHDRTILEVAFFFFLWQIPHFWLLSLRYGREYEAAGLPSPTAVLSDTQFRRITYVWIVAVGASGLALTFTQRLTLPFSALAVVATIWLVLTALRVLRAPDGRVGTLHTFLRLNLYALLSMLLLSLNAVV